MDILRQQTVTAQTEIAVLKSSTNDHFLDLQRQINDICRVNMSLSRQLTQSLQIQTEQAAKIAEYTFMGRYLDYFESDIKTLQRAARINSHDWRIFEDDICAERRDYEMDADCSNLVIPLLHRAVHRRLEQLCIPLGYDTKEISVAVMLYKGRCEIVHSGLRTMTMSDKERKIRHNIADLALIPTVYSSYQNAMSASINRYAIRFQVRV